MDDAPLWDRALSGDAEAFGALFDRHRDRVYRHAWRLVDRPADAEDVTAVAFLELWRRRRDVRVVAGQVLPWLLVTTTNAARNSRRGARRYRALLDKLPRPEERPDEPTDIRDDLAAGLRALATPDLHLVCLVVLEGYPVAEAAEVLGLTESAARSRLHRARTRARDVGLAVRAAPVEEG